MRTITNKPGALLLLAMLAAPVATGASAQDANADADVLTTVYGTVPSDLAGLPEGPEVEGIISARNEHKVQVTSEAGDNTVVAISPATEIKGKGGFLGMNSKSRGAEALLTGLPVTMKTVRWNNGLVATDVRFKNRNLETAAMIHGGTAQRFAQHDVAIEKNAKAAEALRSRMADIDNYNIKGTTNVYFDSGKWKLSSSAQNELCEAAMAADGMDNALLLVVGYTDSVGSQEYNQVLSERRAGRVVNYLQQECGWKPWRMLSPTGMAEADPLADNSTPEGKAQNRRVSVNILVSKAAEEL